jgi:hypothetical protein
LPNDNLGAADGEENRMDEMHDTLHGIAEGLLIGGFT